MKKTLYIVPCFIVVENANSIEEADAKANALRTPVESGTLLFLDEVLPTVPYEHDTKDEMPHSIKHIPALNI
jgi:hypothetical protein